MIKYITKKHLALSNLNNIDILSKCEKICNDDIKINIKSMDIINDYKKNVIEKREQKKIFLFIEKMEKYINDKDIQNLFIRMLYRWVILLLPLHKFLIYSFIFLSLLILKSI